MTQSIVLIGARGSGKSTIGAMLAGRLELPFVDLDDQVLATFAEPTVAAVWQAHGASAWRTAEAACLDEALTAGGLIATGGGVPEIPDAQALLMDARRQQTAIVIYLRATVETLVQRLLRAPGDRPALTDAQSLEDEVATVLRRRSAAYESLADLAVDVDHETARDVCDRLVPLLIQGGGGSVQRRQ